MKTNICLGLITILTLTGGNLGLLGKPVAATNTFSQQELDQSKVIAIAAPINNGQSYQLLILEQIGNQRPCWREMGQNPTTIDPLLLTFDFTDICGRSTDSNGYSVRLGNEDLSWKYSLRIVKLRTDLVLVAVPTKDPTAPSLEIGRSNGLVNGFAKINLNPGWRLTKRTYQGKSLGHIYLSTDQDINSLIAFSSNRSSLLTANSNANSNSNSNSNNKSIEIASNSENLPQTNVSDDLPTVIVPVTPAPSSSGVIPNSGGISSNMPSLPVPPSIPIPQSNQGNQNSVINPPEIPNNSPNYNTNNSLNTNPNSINNESGWIEFTAGSSRNLPTFSGNSNSSNYSSGVSGSSSNSLASNLGFNYRVIVSGRTPEMQNRVKQLVPDAFRTVINGQAVMQAGLFVDQAEAEQLKQFLINNGLPASIMSVR